MTEHLLNLAAVGGQWVIWTLLALSVWSLGIIGDRWIYFARRRIDLTRLSDAILDKLRRGDRQGVVTELEGLRAVEARIVADCLPWIEDGHEAVSERLSASLKRRRPELEQGTTFLGTVGNNAPFIGLLGTVLGVVQAFRELGTDAMGAMGSVMSGIGEALVATAVGILVALPAVVAFNVFTKKAVAVEDNAEALMNVVLAYIKSTRKDRSQVGLNAVEGG